MKHQEETTEFRNGGVLVVLDGIDGCGKSTQVQRLVERLWTEGIKALATREPTPGPWGQRLRRSATEGRLAPSEELEVILNDRRYDVETHIEPGLAAGAVVVVDRYYTSTLAYQGLLGFDEGYLLRRNHEFAPIPDLIFIINVEANIGLQRVRRRGDTPDKFEQEEQLKKVARRFAEMRLPGLLHLDGNKNAENVHQEIYTAVMKLRPV